MQVHILPPVLFPSSGALLWPVDQALAGPLGDFTRDWGQMERRIQRCAPTLSPVFYIDFLAAPANGPLLP